jgi:hypothetical protein
MSETGILLRVLALPWQLSKILDFSHGSKIILQVDNHIIRYTLEFRVPSNIFPGLKVTAKSSIKILFVINRVIFSLTIFKSHVGWLHSRGVKI